METFIEPIRFTTSFFAIAAAIAMLTALKGFPRAAAAWLAVAIAAGGFFSHVVGGVPAPGLVPAVAGLGLALGFAALFSARVLGLFEALDDRQWRMLTALRAVFGALILAAGAAGLMPAAFALPAGLGDLLVGGLALAVPGSLAAGGHRGSRLLVFGMGLVDFVNVMRLQVIVLVPWLIETHSVGISLLLPWVAVPLLATLNFAGVRLVVRELLRPPVTTA